MNILFIIVPFLIYNIENINDILNVLKLYYSEKSIFIGCSLLINIIVYWCLGLFYLMIDNISINKYNIFTKYKIQNNKYPLNNNNYLLYDTIKLVLFNQIIINPIIIYIIYINNIGILDRPLPSTYYIFYDLFKSLLIVEFVFYYIHRLLHTKYLYKHIHYIHHIYNTPIAIGAIYAHPVEYIFGNILPVILGPLILQSHVITFLLFQLFAIINTINSHSGYNIPLLFNPIDHDIHHLKYKYNFGILNILDKFHNTYYNK